MGHFFSVLDVQGPLYGIAGGAAASNDIIHCMSICMSGLTADLAVRFGSVGWLGGQ
jgi:hypothetical protein